MSAGYYAPVPAFSGPDSGAVTPENTALSAAIAEGLFKTGRGVAVCLEPVTISVIDSVSDQYGRWIGTAPRKRAYLPGEVYDLSTGFRVGKIDTETQLEVGVFLPDEESPEPALTERQLTACALVRRAVELGLTELVDMDILWRVAARDMKGIPGGRWPVGTDPREIIRQAEAGESDSAREKRMAAEAAAAEESERMERSPFAKLAALRGRRG